MKIDLQQSKCNGTEVKIGISTSSLLAKIKVSESRKSQFHDDCLKFYIGIVSIVSKLRERSPLQYKLTRAVSALNTVIIYYNPYGKRMNELLVMLHDLKYINATTEDRTNSQYQDFCGIEKFSHKKEFKNINCYKDRRGDFLVLLNMTERFDCLFEVTKIVLILSDGNAQVENGFSIKNNILLESLHENSIVAQRQVYNRSVYAEVVRNVEITNSMVKNVNVSFSLQG